MNKTKIEAQVVADSINPQGDRLTSLLITFPRIILAEVNTHRMLSKNTASSRAIPFFKMADAVCNDPFIPVAWQRHHSGMQGSEYISADTELTSEAYISDFVMLLKKMAKEEGTEITPEYEKVLMSLSSTFLSLFSNKVYTIKDWWLKTRDLIILSASILYSQGVTKQIANRLLEPFMWTTVLITGNEKNGAWNNFFDLRCPKYYHEGSNTFYRSKRDYCDREFEDFQIPFDNGTASIIDWLEIDQGQAEIHMKALAEAIYDAINESTPKQLKAGEWHIPFENKIDLFPYAVEGDVKVKISTAMAARISYTIVGDEKRINYEKMIKLHDKLVVQDPLHASPMEHCARAMSNDEYIKFLKTIPTYDFQGFEEKRGWCRNYKGFIQYRHILENQNII